MNKIDLNYRIFNAIKDVVDSRKVIRPVHLHEPYFKGTNAWKYVKDCIDTGWVSSSGKWVDLFEEKICEITGSPYAVSVSNGTVALRLALYVLGVKPGEEVIIPPLSFVATANAVSHLGANPHFVDIDKNNLGLCHRSLKERLEKIGVKKGGLTFNIETGKRIAAVIPVHVFGMPANIPEILKVLEKWDIPIIEDAAEALGSFINHKKENCHCGLMGDLGIISFNGNKIITTGGGGALLVKKKSIAEKIRHISTTAKIPHLWDYDHDEIGWNDRLPNLNAALGYAQLEDFQSRLQKKSLLSENYYKVFKNIKEVELVRDNSKNICNYWLSTLRLLGKNGSLLRERRDSLLDFSYANKIFLRPAWKPLHLLPMYKDAPKGRLDVIKDQEFRLINLPSSPQII